MLAGCTSSDDDSAVPETIRCDVTYEAGEETEEDSVEVDRQVGSDGDTDSVTFAEGSDAELTVTVTYSADSSEHGLVQIGMNPVNGTETVVQILEFEGEYPGGPETTGEEELEGGATPAEYVCDAAD